MARQKPAKVSSDKEPTQESPRALQKRWISLLREEIDYLHDLSLMLMEERGILPPFYGGEWLSDEDREVLPLWGVLANNEEELGLMLVRVRAHVESNRDLRQTRRQIGISNTWPLERLLGVLGPEGKGLPVEGGEALRGTKIALALFGEQCTPAQGYTHEGLMDALTFEKPIALFVHVPVVGDGEAFFYAWGDVEHFRAEVIYADTVEELEVAVWRYRLEMALADERNSIEIDELDPEKEMLALDVASLAGIFDVMVMGAIRYYGVTTPVKEKQESLDVLRGLDGDLIVRAPLKPEVEPVKLLSELRRESDEEKSADPILVRIDPDSEIMTQIWPQVRAHSHFCMRLRQGEFTPNRSGQPRISGYVSTPIIEWILADSLDTLYSKTTLHCLRQLLVAVGRVRVEFEEGTEDTESIED